MSESEDFKREVDEEGEGVYTDKENDGDGSGEVVIEEGGETGVRKKIAKVSVCGDELGEEDVFAIVNKTWLTGEKGKK